jgi:hypothetical protein
MPLTTALERVRDQVMSALRVFAYPEYVIHRQQMSHQTPD